jgi:NADP-dependent 3-hydroxy acid dehydrogenase YdfG
MPRTLVITGASSGIGAAVARHAAAAGWNLALGARNAERLDALAAELGPERAIAQVADVTDFDQVQALIDAAVERFGRVDAVFANAGFGAKRGFLEESVEHWRQMVLTNVLGCALTIRAALPEISANAGHFVLTGSVAGTRALPGSLYSSTKFAVHGMAESLRQELDGSGARVTLIAPGMVDTPFFERGAGPDSLAADDVARAVMWALDQPPSVDVNMVLVRPTAQSN